MNERILLRSAPLGNWNVPSAAILLPAGERDPETLLRQDYRERRKRLRMPLEE